MCYSLSSWCGCHFGTIFVLHFHWKWELWALCCFCRPLLCCLCCTVYLPSSLLTRCSALLCAPTVQPMFSSVSVDHMPPLPPPTPTLPLPPVTGDTLGKIFWILLLPPLPLLVLSLPCWSHISDTWALPAINHGNHGDWGGVAGMSRGRSVWGLMAVIDLSIHHPLTPFLPSLTSNTTVLTQTPRQLQSSTLSCFLLPTPITRNMVIWFVSTPVKTTKDSLLLSSTPSQLGPKRNVQKLWNSWKMNVLTYCFWQRHGWKLTVTRVSVSTWLRRATSCGPFHMPRMVVDWPWSTETTFLSLSTPPSPSPTPPLNSCNFSALPSIIFTCSAFTDPCLLGKQAHWCCLPFRVSGFFGVLQHSARKTDYTWWL